MSKLKISELSDVPSEGAGKQIHFKHDYTEIDYVLALFQVEGKFYCITDQCRCCSGSLGQGVLKDMFVFCHKDACGWNIRKGHCKFNRSDITPTYKIAVEEDGLYIEI
jgi:nitrite reductase/ring-hydroxylating ferredoxin subunit